MNEKATQREEDAIVPFKTWLMHKFPFRRMPNDLLSLEDFALRVRLDKDWPTQDVSLRVLTEYLKSRNAEPVVQAQLLHAWATYIEENSELVTSKQLDGVRPLFRMRVSSWLSEKDAETVNRVFSLASEVERRYFPAGIENGIQWDL